MSQAARPFPTTGTGFAWASDVAQVTDQVVTTETAFLQITYDDASLDLVQARLVCTEPVVLRIFRKNGASFRDVTVQPGEFLVTFPSGPIRKIGDLNSFGLVT